MYFYCNCGCEELFWSERKLTEAEQKERGLYEEYTPTRIYKWLCDTRRHRYEIRPALNPVPTRRQKVEAFTDPHHKRMVFLRYTDTPV